MRRLCVLAVTVMVAVPGCAFSGVNSLPLPGTVGRGDNAFRYSVDLANVGTLESNSPVMIDDVVVGTVDRIRVQDRHAQADISVRHGVVVPANTVVSVGQTSLLGSMHLQLGAPVGQDPQGQLPDGAVIPLDRSRSYPSTEQTLAALSAVVNPGGLGQIGSIIHDVNNLFANRQGEIRELVGQMDTFVGNLNIQRDNIITTITELDRFAATLAGNDEVIRRALREIPVALDVLNRQRPNLVGALTRLGVFSDTATAVIADTKDYLVRNLENLGPTLAAIADVGPELGRTIAFATVFPMGQNLIDRGIHGDYMNLFVTVDLTHNRLKRGLFAGTRFGDENAPLVPAPGDPGYDAFYTNNPMGSPVGQPPNPSPWPTSEGGG
ncbi:MCE family protein [Mycobacterium sp. AMU20-3851]|uniref:MCE family protein n=1 Tax=Mycobacterium sp. AMU20-3851 TaxID=3122055 RepID=UPI003754A0B0